jgi:type IV pilus assembly protein PilB
MPDTKELGEVLVDEGLITNDQLAQAAEEQQKVGRSLGRVLIDLGLVNEPDLVAVLARQIGLDFVDLTEFQIDPSAAALLSEQVARRRVRSDRPIGQSPGLDQARRFRSRGEDEVRWPGVRRGFPVTYP